VDEVLEPGKGDGPAESVGAGLIQNWNAAQRVTELGNGILKNQYKTIFIIFYIKSVY
jgi:hypothetical protein